jgi:uncharacterized LabA/DUF88 family protein
VAWEEWEVGCHGWEVGRGVAECGSVVYMSTLRNIAYVDGQNLHLGTTTRDPVWSVDLHRFRVFLAEKYHVKKAYYYIGYMQEEDVFQKIYEEIQTAGFILVFRKHSAEMKGKKKGNVDVDIVFSIMRRLYKKETFDKIVLVSGDGDYRMLVDFLIAEGRFEKILFPKQQYASSLYKKITRTYFANLSDPATIKKIGKQRRKLFEA